VKIIFCFYEYFVFRLFVNNFVFKRENKNFNKDRSLGHVVCIYLTGKLVVAEGPQYFSAAKS
jgi:hypothetical protein